MAKLILRIPDGAETEISLDDRESVVIGRSPECDMPITDGQASRRHASVMRLTDGFEVSDLGSTNGTLLNDAQVKKKRLAHGDVIKIGATEIVYDDPDAMPAVGADEGSCSLVYAKGPRKGQKIDLSAQRTTIGRKESNTVALKDTVASSYHCEVVRDLNGYTIRDLGSTNGTLVNNEMVTESQLVHGARIRIGNTRFVFQDPAMSEIDLELAGVDDDEAEWGMMRDLDLASVRKRNPAAILYSVIFIGILGAMGYLVTRPPTKAKVGDVGPADNLHVPYNFARQSSSLDWDSTAPGSVDVSWSKSGKGSLSLRATGEEGGDAVYVEEIDARSRYFKLTGKVSASGAPARLGLRFTGAGLKQWVTSDPVEGGMKEYTVECSAPPWAHEVEVGVRIGGAGNVQIDDVVLVKRGPARVQDVEQGSFRLQVLDQRKLELSYASAPTLATGRLLAVDAAGNEMATGDLSVEAKADGEDDVLVTVSTGSQAALVGVEFAEVHGFLTQGGWRAFTPDQQPDFHASFPSKGVVKFDGVRKLLVGDRGRAFSVTPIDNNGRMTTIATVDAGGNRWAILGAQKSGDGGDKGFTFRIRSNLHGEAALAQAAFSAALQLWSDDRWGEFLEAGQSALAEFPFASASSKERLAKRMGEVAANRAQLVREARIQMADFDEFRDMESLNRVKTMLAQLADRHQIKADESPAGKTYAELAKGEAERRLTAGRAQESKIAEPIFELAQVNLESDEVYAATVLLSYIVNNLPASEQAAQAKSALDKIAKDRPQIVKVLRDVGIGGR
ncbi:MAG: FHA domain-containing protein [Planctomycetota bacterium]|jgi:pSer/pThr/pTyr-binding forkhead associated (FHA) protein